MDVMDKTPLAGLRSLLRQLNGCKDSDEREIFCTPCRGQYGEVAAWVVAVNGSPPRGMIIIGQQRYAGYDDVFFIMENRSRRLGSAQSECVRRFEHEYLKEQGIDKARVVFIPGEERTHKETPNAS